MITVQFSAPSEYIDELTKDANLVYRHIVRVTNLLTAALSPNIKRVSVVATAEVKGDIYRLDHYCGDLWGINNNTDQATIAAAKQVQAQLSEALTPLGLEIRAGLLRSASNGRNHLQ